VVASRRKIKIKANASLVPLMLELRPYQRAAIDGLYNYWSDKKGDNPIIVAPTGSGKSLIIAHLIKDAMSYPGTRVLILTHVKELLEQNASELVALYPEADVGFYSASLKKKVLRKPITFAGIQSIHKKAYQIVPAPDLVIVDEAHLIPKTDGTRYNKFLSDLRICNRGVKVVGLTATPYRLDSGWLHEGDNAIFDGIAYDIPVADLMEQGFLAPVISKSGVKTIDLSNVGKRGGEYIESELAKAASDPELVTETVAEIVRYGAERKAWLVFACGVNHAELLRAEFETHNIEADVVTGADGMSARADKIERFRRGGSKCLINVNVLTTGFNVPHVDLVAIVRATESTGLYIQIVGRGTRIAPGKENCLVLDYGDNVMRHGFIDQIKPKIKGRTEDGQAPVKKCPECLTVNHAAVRVCIECGHEFPPPQFNHGTKAYSGAMISTQVQAEWVEVDDVGYSRWRKEGKPDSIRVTYYCGLIKVSEWLCPDHGGYAAERYQKRMPSLGASAMTTEDAMQECDHWIKPRRIKVKPNDKFHDIVQLDYSQPKRLTAAELAELQEPLF
jgi:DNA repair protein RadD